MSKPEWDKDNGVGAWLKSAWGRFKYWWQSKVVGSSVYNKVTGEGLTGAEREANRFSAEQAQIERDWQEEFYNKYSSPSALMAQYREAGLNPALMYGEGASQGSSPSGAVAQSVEPNSGASLAQIIDMIGLKSQVDLNKANARLANSNANIADSDARWRDIMNSLDAESKKVGIRLDEKTIEKFASEVRNNDVDTILKSTQNVTEGVRQFLYRADARLKEMMTKESEANTRKIYELLPYQEALMSAESENQKAQASAAFAKAAIDRGLLEEGYCRELVRSYCESANLSASETELNQFMINLQNGTFYDNDESWGKFGNALIQGLMTLQKILPFNLSAGTRGITRN